MTLKKEFKSIPDPREKFNELKPYPDEVLKLFTFEGFTETIRIIQELNNDRSREPAYDEVEEAHMKFFGFRRYSNYETFRTYHNNRTRKSGAGNHFKKTLQNCNIVAANL